MKCFRNTSKPCAVPAQVVVLSSIGMVVPQQDIPYGDISIQVHVE